MLLNGTVKLFHARLGTLFCLLYVPGFNAGNGVTTDPIYGDFLHCFPWDYTPSYSTHSIPPLHNVERRAVATRSSMIDSNQASGFCQRAGAKTRSTGRKYVWSVIVVERMPGLTLLTGCAGLSEIGVFGSDSWCTQCVSPAPLYPYPYISGRRHERKGV